jgi:hypothetical protein
MINKTFCVNCGAELSANSKNCTECGSSQDPHELDLSEDVIEARQEPQPPYQIPQDVYNNKNWENVKISFIAPWANIILYIIIGFPLTFIPEPVGSIILMIWAVIFALATIGAVVAFAIYASRDKKLLFEETGHSKVRGPITILIFLFFFHVMYQIYYLFVRSSKYEIEDEDSISSS